MIEVRLYGALGQKYGRVRRLHVKTPAQALRAIDTLHGGFFDMILDLEAVVQGYQVKLGDKELPESAIRDGFLELPARDIIEIVPLLKGADVKGIVEIVAGVALIAVGLYTFGSSAQLGVMLLGAGLSLALGGVARFLMVTPPTAGIADQNSETKSSYVFTGPTNTVQQGGCVPAIYGLPICGSAVVSAGMDSQDVLTGGSTSGTSDSNTSEGGGLPVGYNPPPGSLPP